MLRRRGRWAGVVSLTALLVCAAWADGAAAGVIGYRNDTRLVVVVQCSAVINNAVRRGRPHRLFPGEVAFDQVAVPGNRTITVYDARQPNRVLYSGPLPAVAGDLYLAIQFEVVPAGPGGRPVTRFKLAPVKPPRPERAPAPTPLLPRRR